MTHKNYPAPGKANLLAEIEERLELLNDILDEHEPTEGSYPSVKSVMTTLVGSYGYTYDEYQHGAFLA